MSCKIKDNRQNNFTAKIEVTNADKVKVCFNELWIKMFKVNYSRTKIICSLFQSFYQFLFSIYLHYK
jgi:hypothetical protein